jgi:protein required for attachment to host cells
MVTNATRTWIVVAHRAGARILAHDGPGKELVLVEAIDHPEGRKLEGEIDSDRAGILHGPARTGGHAAQKHQTSHDHIAETFARALAGRLQEALRRNRFAHLVLVAEPRFLGLLKGVLDGTTAKVVNGTVGKDLAATRADEIARHLEHVLAV